MPLSFQRLCYSMCLLLAVLSVLTASTGATASTQEPGGRAVHVHLDNGLPGTARVDDEGHPIDAHDGQIQRFGDRYYLYGTRYGCGFRWNDKKAPFCGFVVYSSSDLAHWRAEGPLFDATTPSWQKRCDGSTYGCFRPHVVFNARTQRYVLWINSYEVAVGYHVFTATTPTGPFVEAPLPKLAINRDQPPGLNHGDHDVFVDHDGTAYLAYTDWRRKGDIAIEQLDESYLSGTGRYARVGLKATEAPSIFRRGDTYYLTFSDPNCGYCTTGTSYLHATSPLGPWTGKPASGEMARQHRGLKISATSCGGQPADVATLPGPDGPVFLFQSDRWDNGNPSETHATHYWEPLRFDARGAIEPLSCASGFDIDMTGNTSNSRAKITPKS
ncbi:glycosyl hydrolase family 43 [Luteibacter sp. OK325]|uniref:family 43 glycosylhydrolase n=1 Tax=Luteibacter sp. OK325 TaxID=2135670 RepID=UPI000D4E8FB2|nr:family 43 glycosylhydrolase [Luteibacter sp. OK325]PTR35296.1 glycosyl hydrolase family 43 [Luteibacter sp. OK325]